MKPHVIFLELMVSHSLPSAIIFIASEAVERDMNLNTESGVDFG